MNRAAVIRNFGRLDESVRIEEIPIVKPGPQEVLVRVYAAGLNFSDYKLAEGSLGPLSPKLPCGLGIEISGEVVEVGSHVSRFIEGDLVWGMQTIYPFQTFIGCIGEFVNINEQYLLRKPYEISHVAAGGIGVSAFTCVEAFFHSTRIQQSHSVLILSAQSSSGRIAVQIAKKAAAAKEVVAVSHPAYAPLLSSLGADHVITSYDWVSELGDKRFDIIYDCEGSDGSYQLALQLLKRNGSYLTFETNRGNRNVSGLENVLSLAGTFSARKLSSFFNSQTYDYVLPKPTLSKHQYITKLLQSRCLKAVIDHVVHFDESSLKFALHYLQNDHMMGKIVIVMLPHLLHHYHPSNYAPNYPFLQPSPSPSSSSSPPPNDNNNNDDNNDNDKRNDDEGEWSVLMNEGTCLSAAYFRAHKNDIARDRRIESITPNGEDLSDVIFSYYFTRRYQPPPSPPPPYVENTPPAPSSSSPPPLPPAVNVDAQIENVQNEEPQKREVEGEGEYSSPPLETDDHSLTHPE